MKIVLPGREFEAIDLVKDWIGVVAAVLIIHLIRIIRSETR